MISKDFFTVAFFDILVKAFTAVSSILLIRFLSVQVYASYVKFNSISSLIFCVVGTSLSVAYARAGTEYTSRGFKCYKTIYNICILLLFISILLASSFIPLMSKLYSATILVSVTSIIYGFVQSLSRINESYFQVKGQYNTAGLLYNAKSIFLIVFLFFAIFFLIDLNELSVFCLFIISASIPVFIAFFLIRKEERNVIDDKLDRTTIKLIFAETVTLVFYWLLLNLIDQTDVVLINHLMDDSALSNYGVALKYYQLLLTLQGSLATVLRIRTAKKEVVDSKKRQAEIFVNWIKKTGIFILCVLIISNVFAEPVLNLLNGERYSCAIPAFRVFVFGAAISYLFAPNVAVMMAAKRYKTLCLFTICGFIINALIAVIFIPQIGIVAAAIATVSGNAFLNIASFFTIIKRGQHNED